MKFAQGPQRKKRAKHMPLWLRRRSMFPLSTLISLRDRLKRLKDEAIDCKSEETQAELANAIAEISFAIERLEAELTSSQEIEKLTRKLAQPQSPQKAPENPPQPFPHITW